MFKCRVLTAVLILSGRLFHRINPVMLKAFSPKCKEALTFYPNKNMIMFHINEFKCELYHSMSFTYAIASILSYAVRLWFQQVWYSLPGILLKINHIVAILSNPLNRAGNTASNSSMALCINWFSNNIQIVRYIFDGFILSNLPVKCLCCFYVSILY